MTIHVCDHVITTPSKSDAKSQWKLFGRERSRRNARGTRRVSQKCEKKRYKRKNVSRRFVSRLEEPKEDRSEKETNADDKEEQIDEEPPSKVVEKEDGEESTVEVGVVREEAIVATATRSEESATEVATKNVESRGVEEVPMATAPLVTESESLVNEEEEPATVLRDDETVAIATDTQDEEPKEIEREPEAENRESSSERVAYPRLERERADHSKIRSRFNLFINLFILGDQEPFSEETLALYYENPELDRNEIYIDEFLRVHLEKFFKKFKPDFRIYRRVAKNDLNSTKL